MMDRDELMTLVAGKRRSLLMAETTTKCMTRSLNVTPKTTEQHLIVHTGEFEAEVTKKDCARGITLLKLTDRKHCMASLQQQSYCLSLPSSVTLTV